ncbi:LPXTG cell wall anchor domain-containing protein [Enterococcus rivorum]|uniref:Uncharacterized protein n=1 Tax=Enterococcus rivorum TaxID=762845 RepID=A0A1E5KYT1_9ENTE|nr:LPXTG cell wall anchor domain-containing protein [Enterococcus rivorum]MBP2097563.1 LPXTG-motif cell wall-anchored protein [Enterococcus rivorum]OEH83015.1 hypothetical protein BCR26_01715 [Enterococcus rivorum]
MHRKSKNFLLIVVSIITGIYFQIGLSDIVFATSLTIDGKIGGTMETSSSSLSSSGSKSDGEVVEPKEGEIYLRKLPSTGEHKNNFLFWGIILICLVWFYQKKSRTS